MCVSNIDVGNWIPNLFKRRGSRAPESIAPPIKPKEPEISCLARGLAKSLEEEPEKWEIKIDCSQLNTHRIYRIFKHSSGNEIHYRSSMFGCEDIIRYENCFFEDEDKIFLIKKLDSYIDAINEKRKSEEKKIQSQKEEYFVNLGCPK